MDACRLNVIPFFAALGPAERGALAEVAVEIEALPGQALTTQGDSPHAMFAIESGTADVVDIRALGILGPGDVFGEIAVIAAGGQCVEHDPWRNLSLVAVSRMRLITLSKRDFWALERRSPAAASRLRELVAFRRGPA